jgi:hypothetical protein
MRVTTEPGIEELYREHALGLMKFALLLTGDRGAAEDVVQDAFLGLHRHWDQVKDPARVLAYLRTAVVNGARSRHRRHLVARRLRPDPPGPVQSAVPVVNARLSTMTMSADGSTLGYTAAACHGSSAMLGVISGHTMKTWPESYWLSGYIPSLSADGSVLAYYQRGPGGHVTARLLDTRSDASSKFLFMYPANVLTPQVLLSRDGAAAYVFWSDGTHSHLTGYRIGPDGERPVLFHEAIATERDLVWAGDRLFLWGGQRTYLVNPANGKLTGYPALWLENWSAVWW